MQLKIHTDGDHDNSPIGSDMTQADVDKLWSAIERNRHIVSDLDGKLDPGSAVDEGSATDEHGSMPLNAASYPPPIDNRHHADDSVSLTSPSTIMLVLANLVPIFGVLYLGWDLGSTMVLFWAETGIILLYTVLKGIAEHKALGLILGLVLISHAGAFMAIHFLFIWTIFVEGLSSVKQPFSTSNLSQVADYLKSLWPALVALLVSHGYSFKHNFLDKRARHLSHQKEDASDKQQNSIYSRITLMHLTIIIGGGIAMLLGRGELSLVLLIVMKLIVDIRAHIKQHDN